MDDDLPPALRGSRAGGPQKKRPEDNNQQHQTPEQIREQAMQESVRERDGMANEVVDTLSTVGSKSPEVADEQQPKQKKSKEVKQYETPNGLIYSIHGDDIQFVEITLKPNFAVIGEESKMMYYDEGIEIKTRMNAGNSAPKGLMGKMMDMGKAALKGEQIFIKIFTNVTKEPKKIAFSTPYPGKILALDINKMGGSVICHKFAFLCAAKGIHISQATRDESGAGAFDNGTKMDRLEGNGFAFICLGGSARKRKLAKGEVLHVNQGVMAARQSTVGYKITKAPATLTESGENKGIESLTGPGLVWLQSLPFNKMRDSITRDVMNLVKKILKDKK